MRGMGYTPNANKDTKAEVIKKVLIYCILGAMAILMLFPIYYLVNVSLKTSTEFFQNPTGFVKAPTLMNFVEVFEKMKVVERTLITLVMTSITCILSVIIAVFAAFPLARNYFKGSNKVLTFILASMFFPTSLVANIFILKDIFHIYGLPIALICMWVSGGIQMNVFMLIGFVKSVPRDLDEAAFIDGCSYFRYIFTTAIPLMLPIIATIVMIKAISCWNDFLGPFLYMTDPMYKTLATGLYSFMSQFGASWEKFASAIFIVSLPMIILYIFFQRFIIEGLASGAVKG